MHELISLLPDGASAVAVIVVVMLFLKQRQAESLTLESVTKGFHDEIHEARKS